MRKSAWILVGSGIALVLVVLGGGAWLRAKSDHAVEVSGVSVSRGAVQAFVKATGFVESRNAYVITAPVSGRLALQMLEVGQTVRRDQVLVRFERADADERAAEAALRAAEAQLQQAERNYRAEKAVWEAGGQSRHAVDEARSGVQIEEAHRDRALAELNAVKVQRANSVVKAPSDGVVTSVEARQGEFATVGAPLLHVAALGQLEVRLKIDQGVADQVRVDQAVELIAESSAEVLARTRISRIDPKIQKEGATSYLVAWASLDDAKLAVRPNQQFAARVLTSLRENTLRVPLDAVTEKDGAENVRVVDNGRLRFRPVKTGIQDGQHVEVLSGVAEGQVVLFSNLRQPLKEGMPVRLAQPAVAP